ncbi:MAG: class I SAM-dependent methyltransferase [Pseudomonadota bacterium]
MKLLRNGVMTLTGIRKLGFFIPFKHAGCIPEVQQPYAGLASNFAEAEHEFIHVLNLIEACADDVKKACSGALKGHWDGGYFGPLDTAATFALVREYKPKRIVEVGSGSSTYVMATASRGLDPCPVIQCIDPVPRSSISDLGVSWEEAVLKDDNIHLFEALEPGDIAFFDSSHVLFEGTDVDIIQNRIMPLIKPGVLVHIHDIFLPDPYPKDWKHRGYTEQLGLAGWILGGTYRLLFSSNYAATRMREVTTKALHKSMPEKVVAGGGSLWLRRV